MTEKERELAKLLSSTRDGRKRFWAERRKTKQHRERTIRKMLHQGISVTTIAELVGVSKRTVWRRKKELHRLGTRGVKATKGRKTSTPNYDYD